jgi:hypothetical protein
MKDLHRRVVGPSLLSPALLTRYWWTVLLFVAVCILAGMWAARYTDITKLWLPFVRWERPPSAARRRKRSQKPPRGP